MREGAFVSLAGKCRILALVFFIIVLAGCQQAPTGPQPLTDADREQHAALEETLRQAFLANDVAAVAALYAEDAILSPPGSEMVWGKENIREWYSNFFKMAKITEFSLSPVKLSGENDWAYAVGKFSMKIVFQGSDTPVSDTGKYLDVRRKQADGSWEFVADTWNSDQPPSQQGESASSN